MYAVEHLVNKTTPLPTPLPSLTPLNLLRTAVHNPIPNSLEYSPRETEKGRRGAGGGDKEGGGHQESNLKLH
jgi:hypothetical protein